MKMETDIEVFAELLKKLTEKQKQELLMIIKNLQD